MEVLALVSLLTTTQTVFFHAAIQPAPAQPQVLGGLLDVSVVPVEGLRDEQCLDLVERHPVEASVVRASWPQPQVFGAHHVVPRHEDRPFHRVVQLADVARPGVIEKPLE